MAELDDDMGDMWRHVKAERQLKHAKMKQVNTKVIVDAGIPHKTTNQGETILLREAGMPVVDFYPSSGRWYTQPTPKEKRGRTYNGGAKSFLVWYEKRRPK